MYQSVLDISRMTDETMRRGMGTLWTLDTKFNRAGRLQPDDAAPDAVVVSYGGQIARGIIPRLPASTAVVVLLPGVLAWFALIERSSGFNPATHHGGAPDISSDFVVLEWDQKPIDVARRLRLESNHATVYFKVGGTYLRFEGQMPTDASGGA